MTETTQTKDFSLLRKQQYANLFTFRKSGEAVKTPIWFAERGGKLYVMTSHDSGKVKRIRNNGKVVVGPSDARGKPLGPTVEARARLLGPDEMPVAKEALDIKYGLLKAVFDFFGTVSGMERAWIEITLAEA
ncbi:MAG: PPOX class F420-dependent oxidoreductase [Chloroflexales bacterium]|nr:PPOX class F420-dependent oxidoreductase [Chloroflexales bacterium]